MEKRDPHLINYNDSIDWKEAFKLHPSPLTPGKSLRKVMTVKMDIPSDKFLTILGGTNGTWLLSKRPLRSNVYEEIYYITSRGKVKFIGKDYSVKAGRGKYIFENEVGDIFLIDTDNDNIINTGFNKIRDGINNIIYNTLITDYGEFAYVKNGILNIPDRNLSIKIKNNIKSIGLNYYTSFVYNMERPIFTSYNLNDGTDIVPKTLVYKDKLIPKRNHIFGVNDEFYYTEFNEVYSTDNNSFIGTLDILDILSKTGEKWDLRDFNFEYTQVITKQKTDSGYVFNVYQH